MSYLVLARKYRPRNFTEMVGQEHVVQALTNALTQQRLHHAYLFTGTRGVGKTTVSRILAKSLNCQGPDGQGGITATPCGVCQACTDIDSGRFVDYTELDAASNRGVDEVQSLLEQAVYKPVQGRFKVFMIDEVHMLTNTAFNAMLKTLEEPPEYLKFVLATTDPQKVPVTVLSRCLQFNLRPMAPETVLSHLTQVLAAENVSAEPQALRLLSRAARGSMRDALSLTDQAIAFGSGQLQEAAVRQMLGAVDRSYVFRLIDALAQGDGKTVVETSDTLRLNGLSAASTLEEMSTVLQRMAVFQAVPQMAGAVDADDPEAAETARLAALMPTDETQLLYSLCLHGRGELGLAPDEYAALTMVLLRLLAFKPQSESAEKKTLTRSEAASSGRVAAGSAGFQASPAPPAALVSAPIARAVAAPGAPPAALVAPVPAAIVPALSVPPSAAAPSEDVVSDASEPPPWPGSDEPDTVRAEAPTATVLPVRSTEGFDGNQAQVHSGRAQIAPEYVAIPVRESPEPGERLQPLPLSAPTPVSARYTPTDEGDVWHRTVQQLVVAETITALVRELALQSQLVARDAGHWLLRVERESLNQPLARERLRAALEAAGHASQISVEVGVVIDSPARRNAAAAAERQRVAEDIVMNDPYVQSLVRDYGAKIVPGSIKPA
ncbi:DNA polymerase III subunit gamma/tau [Acidovorax soli]|uniref:DNA polymerase III subunit gamma/tau n=1 Tax=Acidovorax TaxID=12916 RepID=UPI0026F02EED|nr:DNA polymerase III subunit gamma/tau [Acidovorax soli]MCM2348046.1 DNA polymerase III subunit gamma/tau [Acidovorax soli]